MAKILAFVWFVASLLTVNGFPAENVGDYWHVSIVYFFGFISGAFIADEYNSKE